MGDRTTHARSSRPDRMRSTWDFSAHAPAPTSYCACTCSETSQCMRHVFKALSVRQLGKRTAHGLTRRPGYARASVEDRLRMRCTWDWSAFPSSEFVLRMRQVLDCSTHALVPRLVCACLLAVSDPIGVRSPSYCIRSSVMEAAHALSGLGTSACVIRAPRCSVRSMLCQLVHA